MVKTPEFPLQGRQVQSLVGELRSCIMIAMWQKKKKRLSNNPRLSLSHARFYAKHSHLVIYMDFQHKTVVGRLISPISRWKKLRLRETWLGPGSVEIKWQSSGPADFQH